MRRFEVWLDKGLAGVDPTTCLVEVDDDATDEEIEMVCADALESMVEAELDTGWRELGPSEKPAKKGKRRNG